MSAGWGNRAVIVNEARLNEEIRKRGKQIDAVRAIIGKDWRGRVAQDLVAELELVLP